MTGPPPPFGVSHFGGNHQFNNLNGDKQFGNNFRSNPPSGDMPFTDFGRGGRGSPWRGRGGRGMPPMRGFRSGLTGFIP